MSNSIKVCVKFSYKGESHEPSCLIDLDEYMELKGTFPAIHSHVAKVCEIDTYSYMYEVMEEGVAEFYDAVGLAAEFCEDGRFNVEDFERQWNEQKILNQLDAIVLAELGIEDLKKNEALKKVLLKVYELGSESSNQKLDHNLPPVGF